MTNVLPDFVISDVHGFSVLRDDIVEGGTKARVLDRLIPRIVQSGVVYAAHPFGYGAEALAKCCSSHNKELMLVYPSYDGSEDPDNMPSTMRRATVRPGVSHFINDSIHTQSELTKVASDYADSAGHFFMPVGFNYPEFVKLLKEVILSVPGIKEFREIWVVAGSGLLARTLQAVLPNATVNALDLGMSHCETGGVNAFLADEDCNQAAKQPPTFPSALYYDAKLWQVVQEKGNPGALIWNVAG